MSNKFCTGCKTKIDLSCFTKNSKNPDGLEKKCRDCLKKYRQDLLSRKKSNSSSCDLNLSHPSEKKHTKVVKKFNVTSLEKSSSISNKNSPRSSVCSLDSYYSDNESRSVSPSLILNDQELSSRKNLTTIIESVTKTTPLKEELPEKKKNIEFDNLDYLKEPSNSITKDDIEINININNNNEIFNKNDEDILKSNLSMTDYHAFNDNIIQEPPNSPNFKNNHTEKIIENENDNNYICSTCNII